MSDKYVITNRSALLGKYGGDGLAAILKQLQALIDADKTRGLTTKVIFLDSDSDMKPFGVPVKKPKDPKQNKLAIDSICAKGTPDYLMILGAVDVIPYQDLVNPVYDPGPNGDDDPEALGDLPYACDRPYSRDISDFLGPTRVVGRLPDLTAGSDPTYLVELLKKASAYKTVARPTDYFGLTAGVWLKSTQLSLAGIFGSSKALFVSPKQGATYKKGQLDPLPHFVNCHGAQVDPKFYGQDPNNLTNYPVAMNSSMLTAVRTATVAAFECCYGAQLYDPAAANGAMGITNRYLAQGAYGLTASSTIAYGPEDRNAQADLLCRYFLRKVLAGASLGRAMLESRLDFVQAAAPLTPVDLKTLGQFVLLGDPSIHPYTPQSNSIVEAKFSGKSTIKIIPKEPGVGAGGSRSERRTKLAALGAAIKATASYANRRAPDAPLAIRRFLANQLGLPAAQTDVQSFRVHRPTPSFFSKETVKRSQESSERQHVLIRKLPHEAPFKPLVGLVAQESEGRIIVMKFVCR